MRGARTPPQGDGTPLHRDGTAGYPQPVPPGAHLLEGACGCALALGWVVLAFFSGGFNDPARLVALALAALTLALAVAAAPQPLPAARSARLALAALAGFAAWTALSRSWAPLPDAAGDATERALLYLAALTAGAIVWRTRSAARTVEPALAAGALVVVGYGLLGKLLPSIVEQSASASAAGRLEQPLTYWNAMGALAGIGLVACVRLAGDETRLLRLRGTAAAVAPALAVGLALSFSRGALVACAGGLLALLVLAPTWTQLRAGAICLETGGVAAVAALVADGGHGGAVLAVVVAAGVLAAALIHWDARVSAQRRIRLGRLALPRRAGAVVGVVCVLLLLVPVLAGRRDAGRPAATGATTERLTSAQSNRYDYWRVALDAFAERPLQGIGAGGFRVRWLRDRPYAEGVQQAHSLEIETLAGLGLVGGALLTAMLCAAAVAARASWRADPALASGPAAVGVVWLLHASIDWDWEMPALTLAAVLAAGMLLATAPRG